MAAHGQVRGLMRVVVTKFLRRVCACLLRVKACLIAGVGWIFLVTHSETLGLIYDCHRDTYEKEGINVGLRLNLRVGVRDTQERGYKC